MKRAFPYILILILALAVLVIRNCKGEKETVVKPPGSKDPSGSVNRNHGFDRRVSFLEYTRHAKCRMNCRNISTAEVEEIMREGKINYNKSNTKGRPCPTYALEGVTEDDQRVRIVYAQCDLKTKVVTVIDLGREWECACE
jgi:hypothetical protein